MVVSFIDISKKGKFEYMTKFIEVGTTKDNIHNINYQNIILKEFNGLGEQGWELVSCTSVNNGYGWTGVIMAVFKRRK